MCLVPDAPDVPKMAERQQSRPAIQSARNVSDDAEKRRRGMLATILTSSRGATGPLNTTAAPTGGAPKLGA